MAGIQHLYDIYKKDPKFVEKLLDSEVEVEEKLDGSRFGFEVRGGNEMKFFKRNDSVPITRIDRTLAKYYEKAINHFESFNNEKLSQIPEGWRFGFEYFPNLSPVKITYDRIPLNHLVLTDITVRDPQGKVLEIINDKKTLDEWASTLECEGPPIVFSGKLNSEQREKILSFLHTPADELDKKFRTEKFSIFFIKTLNPEVGKTFMQNSLDKDIEALVFKFDGKNPLKVMNPVYRNQKEEKSQEVKPSDIYSLTLVFLQEFFQEMDFSKIKLRGKTFEERYIEFICKSFNMFCKSQYYKNNFEGEVDFELPVFLTREEAKINYKFVTNEETLQLLHSSSTNRELFKIMLASMRTHKKKAFGFFKRELIWHHNQLVDKIADFIDSGVKESFLSYEEFREVFLVNEQDESWEEYGISSLNEVGFPNYVDVRKPERTAPAYLEVLRNCETTASTTAGKLSNCSLVICDTVPYHEGILSSLKDAKQLTGNKSILCMSGHPFKSMETFKQMTQDFLKKHEDLVHTVVVVKFPNYKEIQNVAREKNLCIDHICCDKNRASDFKIQSGDPDMKHTNSNDNLRDIGALECLKEGDINKFKKLCLPLTHNHFYKLKNDLN